MRQFFPLAIATGLLVTAVTAHAEYYAGASVVRAKYDESGFSSVNPILIQGQLGGKLNDYFAIEGRLGVGVKDDSINVPEMPGLTIDLDIKNTAGLYGKAMLPTGVADLYVMAGFTYVKLDASARFQGLSASDSDSDTDVSYGLGADFHLGKSIDIVAEYARLYDEKDVKIDGLTLGLNFKF